MYCGSVVQCMYVCMYVRAYVCMYVFMYVCMYIYMYILCTTDSALAVLITEVCVLGTELAY